MSGWVKYCRITHKSHIFEAKKAVGGEKCGVMGLDIAKKGQWLCRNPDNGHMWSMSDESFIELYCELGKSPTKKKIKKQEDGHKKGENRHSSSSSEVEKDSSDSYGCLFACRKDLSNGKKKQK